MLNNKQKQHDASCSLTSDDVGHIAGGVDAADVLGEGGVSVVAKQQS